MPRFALSVTQISMICNETTNHMYDHLRHLLQTFNQSLLSPRNLQVFSRCVHDNIVPLKKSWGFIDETVNRVCRPGIHQRVLYNGRKKIHAAEFQSAVAPNGEVKLFARCSLLVAFCSLLVARYFLLVASYFLLVAQQEILKDFF